MKNLSRQPFQLEVSPLSNATYALTVFQRPFPSERDGRTLPYIPAGSIDGLPLASAQDFIFDVLRANRYKPVVLHHKTKKQLGLSSETQAHQRETQEWIGSRSGVSWIAR